jgi:AcrR family transcriptional regulator
VSSRATIAEAACELFLERGYDATSISDITRRAGVARSSFFNYFAAKGDVLWAGFDERADAAAAALTDPAVSVADALGGIGADFEPDALALAITNADAMGLATELERDRALRQRRVQRLVAARLERDGMDRLAAEVRAGAFAAAVMAALWVWADRSAAGPPLARVLGTALAQAG